MNKRQTPANQPHQTPTLLGSASSQQKQVVASITQEVSFSGPLPPPALLREYDTVYPGLAKHIIDLAEKQASHRMHLEKTVVENDARRANWGLVCATVITLVFLGTSAALICTGHDVAGTVLGVTDLAVLVGVFIYGTNSRKQERVQKARIMTSDSEQ